MIPQPAWRPVYESALIQLRAGAVDEALKTFDELNFSYGKPVTPFRPRAEVLGMLRAMEANARVSERTAELNSAGQVTDDSLFAFLSRTPASVQVWTLRGESARSLDNFQAAGSDAFDIAKSHLARLLAKRNLIDYLPPEILSIIGRLAVVDGRSSDIALHLSTVSRRWRQVFHDDSQLWGHVILDGSKQSAMTSKVSLCMARGPVRHLVINYNLDQGCFRLLSALDGRVSGLRSLIVRAPTVPLGMVLRLVEWSWELETLVVYTPNNPRKWDIHFDAQGLSRFPSITRLEVLRRTIYQDLTSVSYPLDSLLSLLPNLRDLIVQCWAYTFLPRTLIGTLRLPSLQTLRIAQTPRGLAVQRPQRLIAPELRVLEMDGGASDAYLPLLFPSLSPPNTQHLARLSFTNIVVQIAPLLQHLPHLASLIHLEFAKRSVTVDFIHALTLPASGELGTALCPKLETLNVTLTYLDDRELEARIRKMVKSRTDVHIAVSGRYKRFPDSGKLWTFGTPKGTKFGIDERPSD